jgi:Mg2+/Co2+ transporter CorB
MRIEASHAADVAPIGEQALIFYSVAVVLLICVSAFFAGSETALTAASKARMHTLAKDGNKRAALVIKLREDKEKLIGTLLFGNTLVNILSSALATRVLLQLFGAAGVVYATVAITALLLIFAEVLPKTLAMHTADRFAMLTAPLVKFVIAVCFPIIAAVSFIVRHVLRVFGIDTKNDHHGDHLEELRGTIDMHRGTEEETQAQRVMLRSILDLAEVDVSEVLIHRKRVTMIDAGKPIHEVIGEILASPFSRLPLWKDVPDNIVGVVHVRALLRELQARGGQIGDLDIMSVAAAPWFIPDTTTLYGQLQAFRERREHIALVVDEYGTFMGLVTLEDILEEIVGHIGDETKRRVAGVRALPDGSFLVDGTVTMRDLNREFEWDLPDDDYATLAGLILHESRMIPNEGQIFNFFGFRFDITRRVRNQIAQIRVTPPMKET